MATPSSPTATCTDPEAVELRRRRRLVWLLVLLAPLVAEFASGNLPLSFLWLLVLYAPLYGGAAVLVRDVARRSRRPWTVVALLGLAYGVAEEAFLSGSLFNPDYADLRLLDFGWIPALGMGAWWTVFVVVLHLVWSTCVPIVLAESVAGGLADEPWLNRRGIAWAAVATVLGAAGVAGISLAEEGSVGSPGQLAGAAAVVVVLVATAVVVGRRPARQRGPADPDTAPPPPRTLVLAGAGAALVLVAGAAQEGPVALTLGAYAALFSVVVALLVRWSARPGWSGRHRLALATGVLIPHVGFALLQTPLVDVPTWVAVGGDVVFTVALVAYLVVAWRRVAPLSPGAAPRPRAARPPAG